MMRVNRTQFVAATVILGVMAAASFARQPASAPPPAEGQPPAAVVEAPVVTQPVGGACCDVVAPPCCPKPCITYHHKRKRKACYDPCAGTAQMVLAVKDPCCCCTVEVPICVPVCCQDAPCVDSRCGLFGRGIVEYSWNCGYRVQIVFTKHGGVRVTYIHG
jgi:hypothetical protein